MLSDFTPVLWHFEGNADITLWLIGDGHIGAKECDEKRFKRDIDAIAADPNARVILLGDLINNATKSSVSNIYEERYNPSEAKMIAAKMLEPIRDKILVGVGGNHEYRSSKEVDDDPAYDIMCKLNLSELYRQNGAFVKIMIGATNGAGLKNPTYTIYATHGAGAGTTPGAGANRMQRTQAIFEGIDLFVQGHVHKAMNFYPERIRFDTHNNKVQRRTIACCIAPSYLEYGGYAMRASLPPFANVTSTITLCGNKKRIIAHQTADLNCR